MNVESRPLLEAPKNQRLVLRFAAFATSLLLSAGQEVIDPVPAQAETGGYPDANAVVLNIATYDWWKDENGNGIFNAGEQNSPRGYGYRNCTDWVAWRIPQLGVGSVPAGLHNAADWDNNVPGSWTIDTTPEPGDIAQSETPAPYGHVGVVEKVNKSPGGAVISIEVSEYNKNGNGAYSWNVYAPDVAGVFWRSPSKKWDRFIDLNGSGKGLHGVSLEESIPSPYAVKGVSAVQNFLGGVSVFTATADGRLSFKDQLYPGEDLSAKPWGTISTSVKGMPEIVVNPQGVLSVFSHGTDAKLHHSWQTGPGMSWPYDISPWDVSLRGDPSAVFNYTGGVSIFVPDQAGAMREIDQIGPGASMDHSPVHNLGGNFQGKPATINVDGGLAVFARSHDNYLYTKYQFGQGGAWSGWELLGGRTIKGDPKVFVNRLGGLTVMAIGEQGDIVGIDQLFKGESMNKPFYSLAKPPGTSLKGSPAILQTTFGEQMVFATGEDGNVYHRAQVIASNYQWTGFFILGGALAGSPTVIRNSANGATLFGRTTDGTIVSLDQPAYGVSFNTQWRTLGMG